MGSAISRQSQVKPTTVAGYLSAIRSWHADHKYSLAPFETPRIKLLLQGGKSFFPSTKAVRLPITKQILTTITAAPPTTVNDLNLDTVFKVALAGFMQLGKITYTDGEKMGDSFQELHLTRFDIIFSEKRPIRYLAVETEQKRCQSHRHPNYASSQNVTLLPSTSSSLFVYSRSSGAFLTVVCI